MSFHPVVRPPALREGDCIGLAAPASAFQEEELHAGVRVLQDLGFRVHYTPRLFEKYYYLAGSDAARAAELNALFADPAIQGDLLLSRGLWLTAPAALSRYGHDHGPSENLCGL